MGHIVFIAIHLIALLFGAMLLLLTIPLHLLYAAVSGRSAKQGGPADSADWKTHARCPQCREQVRRDAVKCKHCGSALDPAAMLAEVTADEDKEREDRKNMAIGVAIVIGMLAAAIYFGPK